MRGLIKFLLITAALGASACSINRNVAPVQASGIDQLCIESNDKVLMKDFEPTLSRLIEERGVRTRFFSGARPEDCRHVASYVANWRWDFAMYLYYVRIEIFEDFRSVGLAEYDAALGGLNLDKFGSTEHKLRPLIEQLFPA
jgi:hypothetical protein